LDNAEEMTDHEEEAADQEYEEHYVDDSKNHHAVVEPLYIELILNSKMNMASRDTFYMMDHTYD
jgi:hypothetical protein